MDVQIVKTHKETNHFYYALFEVHYLIRAGPTQNRSLGWLLSSTTAKKVDTVKTKRLHGEMSLDLIPALLPGD